MSKHSLILSDIILDENQGSVMLFSKKRHALIGVEILSEDDRRIFYMMDFIPAQPTGMDLDSIKENEIVDGIVRIRKIDITSYTKERLFSQLQLDDGYTKNFIAKPYSLIQINNLMSIAQAQMTVHQKYQISGNDRRDAEFHNCMSWAKYTLKAAGIKIETNIIGQTYDKYYVANPAIDIKSTSCSIM